MNRILDIHVHIQPLSMMAADCSSMMLASDEVGQWFERLSSNPEEFLRHMDAEGIEKAVLITCVAETVMGYGEDVNDWVARFTRNHRDRLIPFGSIDPTATRDAGAAMDRLLGELRVAGLKLHPPHQLFYANQYRTGLKPLELIYRRAEEAGIPITIHTGTSVFPRARNVYADPLYCDDVAVDFPRLKLILAHAGRPFWADVSTFLARRHPNVYLDLSGIPPQNLLAYLPRFEELASKLLWGSDWAGPGVPGMRANVERFLKLPLGEETRRRVLYENAAGVLGLE